MTTEKSATEKAREGFADFETARTATWTALVDAATENAALRARVAELEAKVTPCS